jgi:hypothetical protein
MRYLYISLQARDGKNESSVHGWLVENMVPRQVKQPRAVARPAGLESGIGVTGFSLFGIVLGRLG